MSLLTLHNKYLVSFTGDAGDLIELTLISACHKSGFLAFRDISGGVVSTYQHAIGIADDSDEAVDIYVDENNFYLKNGTENGSITKKRLNSCRSAAAAQGLIISQCSIDQSIKLACHNIDRMSGGQGLSASADVDGCLGRLNDVDSVDMTSVIAEITHGVGVQPW